MQWLVLATMAAMGACFALMALGRRAEPAVDAGTEARREALKAQLAEADRDLAQDRLNPHEHSLVRAEIARQLFKLEDAGGRPTRATRFGRPVLLASGLAVPVLAVALYAAVGSPGVEAQPFAERTDIRALVARAERQLRRQPNDARGWLALAPVYTKLNRPADAAKAYRAALEAGEFAAAQRSALLTDWAEAETIGAGAPVAPVRARLEEALALDEDNIKARFLLAVATEEAGEADRAIAAWNDLLARYPQADAGWVAVAKERLVRQQVAASIPAEERGARIEGMVAGLANRLESEPDDLEGWARLIRSYAVLGRAGAARSAYERARDQFEGQGAALARLADAATKSGVAIE